MLRTFGDRAHILYLLRIGHNHTLLLTNVALAAQNRRRALPAQPPLHTACIRTGCAALFQRLHRYYHAWFYYRENGRILQVISCKKYSRFLRSSVANCHFHRFIQNNRQVFVNSAVSTGKLFAAFSFCAFQRGSFCTGCSAQMAAKPAAAPAMASRCRPFSSASRLAAKGNVRLPTLCPSARKP